MLPVMQLNRQQQFCFLSDSIMIQLKKLELPTEHWDGNVIIV